MLFYIIKWSLIYFILILILHNLYLFFQKNLTTIKTKDYYNFPNKEYHKINNILNSNNIIISEKVKNDDTLNNYKLTSESNLTRFVNNDLSLNIIEQNNNNAKILGNYDINLSSKNIKTSLNENTFNLENFNSQFENNNMKGELEEFLNKLNN